MKTAMRIVSFLLCLPVAAGAVQWNKKGVYRIFVQGDPAGTTSFELKKEGGKITSRSSTHVLYEDYYFDMEATVELDAKSLRPISYRYQGVKRPDKVVAGEYTIKGDSIVGYMEEQAERFPAARKLSGRFPLFMENYTEDHVILLVRAYYLLGKFQSFFEFIFPSDFMFAQAGAYIDSEAEVRTKFGPIVCKKLRIKPVNSPTFFSYVVEKEQLPILQVFPAAQTEIFLEDYFGKDPKRRFRKLD